MRILTAYGTNVDTRWDKIEVRAIQEIPTKEDTLDTDECDEYASCPYRWVSKDATWRYLQQKANPETFHTDNIVGYAVVCDNTIVAEVDTERTGYAIIGAISKYFREDVPIVQVIYHETSDDYEITTDIDEDRIIKLFGEQPCSDD